jgi:hypothetical protein
MSRHSVFATLSLLALGVAAAPANAAGDNAVVIDVSHVRVPGSLPNLCRVNGVVSEVLAGKTFREGQQIVVQVPCGSHSSPMLLLPAVEEHSAQLIDPNVLAGSKLAGAHLDDAGNLLWEPTRSYGHWGAIWGFRPFEGVLLNRQAS